MIILFFAIITLSSADEDILNRLRHLERLTNFQNDRILKLERKVETLGQAVVEQKAKIHHLQAENVKIKTALVKSKLNDFSSDNSGFKTENARLTKRNDIQNTFLQRRILGVQKELATDNIAFYSYMAHDEPNPGGHHTLVYDVIRTNVGNAYNNFTGIFTCPRTGLYVFLWSTRVACHKGHTTELVVNGNILGSTYAYCGYNTVTGHVVASVSQGAAVFVRTHSISPGEGAIKSDEFGRSAFSGYLIM